RADGPHGDGGSRGRRRGGLVGRGGGPAVAGADRHRDDRGVGEADGPGDRGARGGPVPGDRGGGGGPGAGAGLLPPGGPGAAGDRVRHPLPAGDARGVLAARRGPDPRPRRDRPELLTSEPRPTSLLVAARRSSQGRRTTEHLSDEDTAVP